MDKTVRALTDLSLVDDQLSGKAVLIDEATPSLEARRAALRGAIPGVFLAVYDALGRVNRRPVVVAVLGAHCGGCYLRLPPQLDSAIHRSRSLCPCPHCRRLLYLPPPAEGSEGAGATKGDRGDRRATAGAASARIRRTPGTRPARRQREVAKRRGPRGTSPVDR